MADGGEEIDDAVRSGLRQLRAVDELGPEWAESDKIRFVRAFVEEGVAEAARADEMRSAFLAECVTQAGENMQDARIHILERRTEAQKDEPTAVDFLLNLGLVLALELLVVSTATYAVPALVLFAAARSQARQARRVATVRGQQERVLSQHARAAAALDALSKRIEDSASARDALQPYFGSPWKQHTAHLRAIREVRALENEYALARAALERDEALVQRVKEAVERPLAPGSRPRLTSAALQSWMDGTLTEVVVNRVAEDVSGAVAGSVLAAAAGAGPGPDEPFRTDTLVGRFLHDIRVERDEAAQEWSSTRLHLRCLSDDDFIGSQTAQELYLRIHADPTPALTQNLAFRDRTFLVKGVEAALWLAWLRHLEALGRREVTGRPRYKKPFVRDPEEGRISESVLVSEVRRAEREDTSTTPRGTTQYPSRVDVGRTAGTGADFFVDGLLYPGIDRIRDDYAQYLYREYARPFFVRQPGKCPAALEFDARRYDDVASMPEQWPPLDQERRARVAEMKLLVLEFFRLLESDPTLIGGGGDSVADEGRRALRELLGLPEEVDLVGEFLASLPPTSDPEVPDDDPSTALGPDESLDPAALERDAREALAALGQMVTDLDLAITQHTALSIGSTSFADIAEDRAAKAEAHALESSIDQQQHAVRKQYARVLELAADLPTLREETLARYDARIVALTAWPKPGWSFYEP